MNKVFLFSEIIKDRPVAYHPDFAKALGSVQTALFLSQLLYWSDKGKNGWIYKTQQEFYEETGLSRREQETARRKLKERGILEEKYQGIPRKLYYKVNFQKLAEVMFAYYTTNNNAQISHYGMADSAKQECSVSPEQYGEKQHTITEITTENTSEIIEREEELPKKTGTSLRESNGGGQFDGVKSSEAVNSANRLPKPNKAYVSPHAKQIVNSFKEQFLMKFGIPPTITSKAVQELEAILSRLSDTEKFAFVNRASGAIERFLESNDPFLKKAGYSFQLFVSTMQKYMLEEKKEENQSPPADGEVIEEIEL